MEVSTPLLAVFSEVPDPRRNTLLKQHLLADILLLSLFATLSGCDTDEEIEEYGKNKEAFLRKFLFLPNGIPSHDTITRVLNVIDQRKFAACLYRHSRYLCEFMEEHHISVDGKVLRATAQAGKRNSGICVVTAWACEQQGHYLLSLKKNQKNTFVQVEDYMMRYHPGMLNDKQVDFGSGRIETRTCYVCERTDLLEETLAWKNIQSVVMIHAIRETNSKQQEEYRFYLSDQVASPAYFNEKVREHWGVENQLLGGPIHWHLDVSFGEDRCRTNTKNGAENRNTLRKMALQLSCGGRSNRWTISTASE